MAERVIYVRGKKSDVLRAIRRAAETAAAGGQTEAQQAVQLRVGLAVLGHIREAFVAKARGGADETGLRWPPLSPMTIAYRRRHPGLPPAAQRAAKMPSWALTERQRQRWWEIYRRALARFKGDKSRAARVAWAAVKASGAETLLDKYGATRVEILRDIGLLLNSLSPGVVGQVEHQVFRVEGGAVIVGTNRVGAASHHEGVPGRLPQRRLWPEPDNWPEEWWRDIAEQAAQGYIDVLVGALRNL